MTRREKNLSVVFGSLVAAGLAYAVADRSYFAPARQREGDIVARTNDLRKQERQNSDDQAVARRVGKWAARTFDTDEVRAAARLGATLAALVERAGLNPRKLSLQPVSGTRVRGAYREIGRTIRVSGKLGNLVDFLYLLRQQPHLHRLDNITIMPIPRSDEMDLQARYSTLILEGEDLARLPVGQATTQSAPVDLDSDQRRLLDAIASRDIFRPYIQRRAETIAVRPPPAAPPAPEVGPRIALAPRPEDPPPPPPTRFKLVGLPRWDDRQEAVVSDEQTKQVRTYKPGDDLGGGTFVTADFRPIPSPKNPQVLSPSRVIIRIGPDYWAVDLGCDMTEKRRLRAEQLPPGLKGAEEPLETTTHPAEARAERPGGG